MQREYFAHVSGSPPAHPSSPVIGYPQAGNPSTLTVATEPGPYWYHMMTEEIMAVISAAGITPNATTLTQLRDAIIDIATVNFASTPETEAFVLTTKAVTPAGLGATLASYALQSSLNTTNTNLATTDAELFAIGQTWSNSSRSFGVTYTNSSTRPIMGIAGLTFNTGSLVLLSIDGVSVSADGLTASKCVLSFIIPPGSAWRIDDIAGVSSTFDTFLELS